MAEGQEQRVLRRLPHGGRVKGNVGIFKAYQPVSVMKAALALLAAWNALLVLLAANPVKAAEPFQNGISATDVSQFVSTGNAVKGLHPFIKDSGWTKEEIKKGLVKSYNIKLSSVHKFLRSDPGEKFLKVITEGYRPRSESVNASTAIRAAIMKDASDGQISALGIMQSLPVDFHVSGTVSICADNIQVSRQQRNSIISWYLFLPACIYASQDVR